MISSQTRQNWYNICVTEAQYREVPVTKPNALHVSQPSSPRLIQSEKRSAPPSCEPFFRGIVMLFIYAPLILPNNLVEIKSYPPTHINPIFFFARLFILQVASFLIPGRPALPGNGAGRLSSVGEGVWHG